MNYILSTVTLLLILHYVVIYTDFFGYLQTQITLPVAAICSTYVATWTISNSNAITLLHKTLVV